MLTVTEDMVGDNHWTCFAKNSIEGRHYETATEVKFKAGMYCILTCSLKLIMPDTVNVTIVGPHQFSY